MVKITHTTLFSFLNNCPVLYREIIEIKKCIIGDIAITRMVVLVPGLFLEVIRFYWKSSFNREAALYLEGRSCKIPSRLELLIEKLTL